MKKFMISTLALIVFGWVEVQALEDGEVWVPVQDVYLPTGFDDNDVPQVVLELKFENACYRLKEVEVDLDELMNNRIYFRVIAHFWDGGCSRGANTFPEVVDLTRGLPRGEYQILEREDEDKPVKDWGVLRIGEAKSAKPDDFHYANVDSAAVYYIEEIKHRPEVAQIPVPKTSRILVLFGTHSDSCLEFPNQVIPIRHTAEGLIEVLPILQEVSRMPCDMAPKPFVHAVPIPENIPGGHYLFHIRKADRRSFNKLIDLEIPQPGVWP